MTKMSDQQHQDADHRSFRRRRSLGLSGLAVAAVLSATVLHVDATGSTLPSAAPTVTLNVPIVGTVTGCDPVSCDHRFWRLPSPLLVDDLVTIAWKATPESSYGFYACIGTYDDFSWSENLCNMTYNSAFEYVDKTGSRDRIRITRASATPFLAIRRQAHDLGYQIIVEKVQSRLVPVVAAPNQAQPTGPGKGRFVASVFLTNSQPAPDGISATLKIARRNGQTYTRQAVTRGGKLTFSLSLPKAAAGERVSVRVLRGATPKYLRMQSSIVKVRLK